MNNIQAVQSNEDEYLVMRNVSIIKHIPHSSLRFPKGYPVEQAFGKDWQRENYKLCDLFVDKLFKDIPGIEIKAEYSRLYCDVEKFIDPRKEPMAKYGQGHIYTKGILGSEFKRGGHADQGIDAYYRAHHEALDKATEEILASGKEVLILDLHSYSEEQARHMGKEGPFPDICIGIVDGYYDPKILKLIIRKVEEKGYSYQINYPYEGSMLPDGVLDGSITGKVISIMLEVNKRVYL